MVVDKENGGKADALDDVGVVPTIPTLGASLVASLHGVPDAVEDAGIVREQGRVVDRITQPVEKL